ncbi:hypothetical protein STEG23_032347 [Scotinomys teguina]
MPWGSTRNLRGDSTASLEVEACGSLGIRRQSGDLSLKLSPMPWQREDGCVAWGDTKAAVSLGKFSSMVLLKVRYLLERSYGIDVSISLVPSIITAMRSGHVDFFC